jgi:hypothetical protein
MEWWYNEIGRRELKKSCVYKKRKENMECIDAIAENTACYLDKIRRKWTGGLKEWRRKGFSG